MRTLHALHRAALVAAGQIYRSLRAARQPAPSARIDCSLHLLESRRLLSSVVTLPGTVGNDDFRITRDGSGAIHCYVGTSEVAHDADVGEIIVDGGTGDDTLTFDLSNGWAALPFGIRFDAGAGSNMLALTGSPAGTPPAETITLTGSSTGIAPSPGAVTSGLTLAIGTAQDAGDAYLPIVSGSGTTLDVDTLSIPDASVSRLDIRTGTIHYTTSVSGGEIQRGRTSFPCCSDEALVAGKFKGGNSKGTHIVSLLLR